MTPILKNILTEIHTTLEGILAVLIRHEGEIHALLQTAKETKDRVQDL